MGSRSRSNILQPRTDAATAREARSATAPRGRSGKAPWLLLVQLGRDPRAGPGACSVTRAAAPECLLAGTRQAVGKRLCGRIAGTTVAPEFVPKQRCRLAGVAFLTSSSEPNCGKGSPVELAGPILGQRVGRHTTRTTRETSLTKRAAPEPALCLPTSNDRTACVSRPSPSWRDLRSLHESASRVDPGAEARSSAS